MALLAYNRKKQFLAPHVEAFIKQLTGFEEDDKNYQEVARFVYANIIHHNFATVDISSVQKSVEGIVQKFKVHGLSRRGERFQKLVNDYVSSDSSQHSQLNVQWHVLLLLLKLSHCPTHVSEQALKASEDETDLPETEEDINWAEYLQEGWEKFQSPTVGDTDDELWLSSSDEEKEVEVHQQPYHLPLRTGVLSDSKLMSYGVVPHPELWRPPAAPTRKKILQKLLRDAAQSEQWLRTHVQNSWWCDASFKDVSDSRYPEAHTCELWEKCKTMKQVRDSCPLYQLQVVSEFKVMQEVLWMLQVSPNTSLFRSGDNEAFTVNPNISLPTTIPDSLRLVLEDLCPYFTMVKKLKKFEEDLYEQEMSEHPPPVTYKAYSAALFQQLSALSQLVISIETKLNKQEETMTLVSMQEELTPGLNILHYLYDIHTKAVTDWGTLPPWLCATRLLSVFYEALLEANDQVYLEASLYIFMHSFHVYMDIIDVWLSDGHLEDWRDEFLVFKEGANLVVRPYEAEMKKCGVAPVSLLSKLVRVVRDAGRTMEMVSQLNKLAELRNTVLNKGCLFKEFSENVYSEIKRLKENKYLQPSERLTPSASEETNVSTRSETEVKTEAGEEGTVTETSNDLNVRSASDTETHHLTYTEDRGNGNGEGRNTEQPNYLTAVNSEVMFDNIMRSLLENPLLRAALRDYFPPGEPGLPRIPAAPQQLAPSQPLHSMSLVGLMSMHSVLERELELITDRHRTASRLVTQALRTEHSLLEHFTVLRTVFFMEAGNLAQSFYSYLFVEIESGAWRNPFSLSVHLQLRVEELYPGFGKYFAVLVQKGDLTTNVHKAIPFISLAYRVDWPVNLVITEDCIDSYNKVFRFLLHLKHAFWTLHNMRFSDLSGSKNILRVRQLYVLRHWMYHSTNTLHAYFMGQVLRSFSTHLDESVQLADSLDLITQAHNKFLDEVKMHCLQDKKGYVEKFIMKLLRLCSTLSDFWQREVDGSLTDPDAHNLQVQFLNTYRALVDCLDIVVGESDAEYNSLCELKSEFSHSIPDLIWYN